MLFLTFKLPNTKNSLIAVQSIFGVGKSTSVLILKNLGFCLNFKLKQTTEVQKLKFSEVVKSLQLLLGNELKKNQLENFNSLLKIKLLKSIRKMLGLPIRGQRTQTNAKTAKKMNKNLNSV